MTQNVKRLTTSDGNYICLLDQKLGEGQFGTVYKGHREDIPTTPIAIKAIPIQNILQSKENENQLVTEINVLRMMNNENAVKYLGTVRSQTKIYIFMEYCNQGDLRGILNTKKKLPVELATSILKQLAECFISEGKIVTIPDENGSRGPLIHRDIKPENILLHNGKVKLADFGLAKLLGSQEITEGLCGTLMYASPQIIRGYTYGPKCDVWSTGVVFLEIINGITPFFAKSFKELIWNQKYRKPLNILPIELKDSEIGDLLIKMLAYEEKDRIDWLEVLNHPALSKISQQQIKWNNLYNKIETSEEDSKNLLKGDLGENSQECQIFQCIEYQLVLLKQNVYCFCYLQLFSLLQFMEQNLKKVNRYIYSEADKIGKGSTANVYLGFFMENGEKTDIAVKKIKLFDIIQQKLEVPREFTILNQLSNVQNVVQFLDCVRTSHNVYLIMEYCEGGTLREKIEKDGKIKPQEACSIIKQIASVFVNEKDLKVVFDQEKNNGLLAHFDIKPENIYFKQNIAKLGDFGTAEVLSGLTESYSGSPVYMSPQVQNGTPHGQKADIWSLGTMFYEMLTGVRPFIAGDIEELLELKLQTRNLEIPDMSEEINDLLKKMLAVEEEDRIDWRNLIKHPALTSIPNVRNFDQVDKDKLHYICSTITKDQIKKLIWA